MALLAEGFRLSTFGPFSVLGGNLLDRDRAAFGKPAHLRSLKDGDGFGTAALKGGYPSGALAGTSWSLPQKPGAGSSRGYVVAELAADGEGSRGRNGESASGIVFTATGAGQLIVQGSGVASVTLDGTGAGSLKANGLGSAVLELSATGAANAIHYGAGTATLTFDATAQSYAIAHGAGSSVSETELSPESLARAVWEHVIEGGYTAEESARLRNAILAGDLEIVGNTVLVKSLDGSKTRASWTTSDGQRSARVDDVS